MPEDAFQSVCRHSDSCALSGAAGFFAGIEDALVAVNGPMWCYFYAMRTLEQECPMIARRMISTQLDNYAIVFGAEEYIRETLAPHLDPPPALLAVENSCAAGLIGDDVRSIARGMGFPRVAAFDSGGLGGMFAAGYRKAARACMEELLPQRMARERGRVNLLGLTPAYLRAGNDTRELVRLLELSGYTVGAAVGGGYTAAELEELGRAELNIVVHAELGTELAVYLEESTDVPYIAPLPPYGIEGTRRWLAEIGDALPAAHPDVALAEADQMQRHIFFRVNAAKSMWGDLWYERAVIAAPPSAVFGIAHALRGEWADMGHLAVLTEDYGGMAARYAADMVDEVAAPESMAGRAAIAALRAGIFFGSGSETAGLPGEDVVARLHIAQPAPDALLLTDAPLMGLRGAAYAQEYLWNDHIRRAIRRAEKGGDHA